MLWLGLVFVLSSLSHSQSYPDVSLRIEDDYISMSNGFVYLEFNLRHPQIDVLKGCFDGSSNYGQNVLTGDGASDPFKQFRGGIVLERVDTIQQMWPTSQSCSQAAVESLDVVIVAKSPTWVKVNITSVLDQPPPDTVLNSTWSISLQKAQRSAELSIEVSTTRDYDLAAVRASVYGYPSATYGLFEHGVMSVIGQTAPYFCSNRTLERAYMLSGGNGKGPGHVSPGSLDIVNFSGNYKWVALLNSQMPVHFFRSGVMLVMHGESIPDNQIQPDPWKHRWFDVPLRPVKKGDHWTVGMQLFPNNFNFPVSTIRVPTDGGLGMPMEDIQGYMAGIYGNAVAGLMTYHSYGKINSNMMHPFRWVYVDMYTFYDPDTFLSISAMMYAGDPYLQQQVWQLINITMQYINSTTGQVPHNFVGDKPVFSAISGATQPGPNMFWLESILLYIRETGNYDTLSKNIHKFKLALKYLTDAYDPDIHMLYVPGSLWADTLKRNNFTSDSNAYMVRVLTHAAEAFKFLGMRQDEQDALQMAHNITIAMNEQLWSKDHFITQRNRDGSTRDFVDYDSNLLAVGIGIPNSKTRMMDILRRVDSGVCTHVKPTYISEKFYGPEDCFSHNDGDSVVSMGRIAWADALARKRANDSSTLYNKILQPILTDVNNYTWLFERFICDPKRGVWGEPGHSEYFIEYGEVTTMILREVKYGIRIGFQNITVDPLHGVSGFMYNFGGLSAKYTQRNVCIQLPKTSKITGTRYFDFHGLYPNLNYTVDYENTVRNVESKVINTNPQGTLVFDFVVKPGVGICAHL